MMMGLKRGRGRPPLSLHARTATVTLALPEEMMAEVEALVQLTDPPQRRTAVLQFLLAEGLKISKCPNQNDCRPPPLSLHSPMVTVSLSATEELMAEVEALVGEQHTDAPQQRAAVLRALLADGLHKHRKPSDPHT